MDTTSTRHPLHAAILGAGVWLLSGDARYGAAAGTLTLAYMMTFGHSLPGFGRKDDPAPSVIIPNDYRKLYTY